MAKSSAILHRCVTRRRRRMKGSGREPLQAPAGAEKLSFIAGHVTITGAFPEFDSETRTFIAAVQGRRVTVARIYELANAMEEAYARAGYVLVRVMVPEQKLNDHGPLKIVVVDGFIEKVQVDNVQEPALGHKLPRRP